jgi:hypothetical protein
MRGEEVSPTSSARVDSRQLASNAGNLALVNSSVARIGNKRFRLSLKENKMPKINIDRSLQSILDPLLTIARGTFAKNGDDESLVATALLTFSGMGLATMIPGQNGPTWVPTPLLIEQSKEPAGPIDLTSFMAECVASNHKADELKMTGSLRLIIQDIVDAKRQEQPELTEREYIDAIMMSFGGQGLVSFDTFKDGDDMWAATPELLDQFESIRDGLSGRLAKYRRSKIRLGDRLEELIKFTCNMLIARFGKRVNKREVTLAFLLAHERAGNVIAYKDDEGHLAWKASDEMLRSYE